MSGPPNRDPPPLAEHFNPCVCVREEYMNDWQFYASAATVINWYWQTPTGLTWEDYNEIIINGT